MEQLFPCPYCFNSNVRIVPVSFGSAESCVLCPHCRATGPVELTSEGAAAVYNMVAQVVAEHYNLVAALDQPPQEGV